MDSHVSREAVIEAISDELDRIDHVPQWVFDRLENRIKRLPSAQPEIVRCKDCRYYNSEEKECLDLMGHGRRWEEDDFCSFAERREVTE